MKYSLQILKNKNLFKRHKNPSPNALKIKYFWTLSYNHWVFFGIAGNSKRTINELFPQNILVKQSHFQHVDMANLVAQFYWYNITKLSNPQIQEKGMSEKRLDAAPVHKTLKSAVS